MSDIEKHIKTIEHDLEDYDDLTLSEFIEKLSADGLKDDAVFNFNKWSEDGCCFTYKRYETDKERDYRINAMKSLELRERQTLVRLKIKYETSPGVNKKTCGGG